MILDGMRKHRTLGVITGLMAGIPLGQLARTEYNLNQIEARERITSQVYRQGYETGLKKGYNKALLENEDSDNLYVSDPSMTSDEDNNLKYATLNITLRKRTLEEITQNKDPEPDIQAIMDLRGVRINTDYLGTRDRLGRQVKTMFQNGKAPVIVLYTPEAQERVEKDWLHFGRDIARVISSTYPTKIISAEEMANRPPQDHLPKDSQGGIIQWPAIIPEQDYSKK